MGVPGVLGGTGVPGGTGQAGRAGGGYDAWETEDMLKPSTRTGGIAARLK
jgi:hypothetical protein